MFYTLKLSQDDKGTAMQYVNLGRSGLKVSRLCLGTMNFSCVADESEAFKIMDEAVAKGGNFFDNADVYVKDPELDTKGAFWHSKNATVENSVVKGGHLGWFSENLTLLSCKIIDTQPLCYCKKLALMYEGKYGFGF